MPMPILARLLKAKRDFKPITKDGYNPHYKSRFASLDSILDAVEIPLNDQGIIIVNQVIDGALRTTLLSEDGELCSSFPLPTGTDPQKLGASITYGRRYNLSALLNLRTDDDDDAASAVAPVQPQSQKPKQSHTPNGNGSAITSLMAESDRLMQQLGWDAQQGAAALGRIFPGRRSRRELTPGEFQKFNQILSREVESVVGG